MNMDKPTPDYNLHLDQQIRLEEIRLLYGGTLFSYTASFSITVIVYFVLTGHVVSETNLATWLALSLVVLLLRSIDSYRFSRQNEQNQKAGKWRYRFIIGSGVAGFVWGLLPWLGFSADIEYFAFTIVCLVGVISGALSTLSYRWETMALFLVPASSLLTIRLLMIDQSFSVATAIVLIVFTFFALSSGKRIFDNTQQNIRLRLAADNRERAIELMHQKQALHLQNTPLAIIEFDVDFAVTEWNKAAEKIFGYTREQAIGENIMRLILPRSNSSDAEKLWERLLNHEAVIGTVMDNKTRSGELIACEWFITPLTDEHHEIVGIAAMALDITEKKRNELAIIKSKEEAEKANQAKSDFLSSMSHELRTPLNAILGFTQLLKYEKTLTEKQQSHISEISNAGNLLLELVNQILDLSRIEKGHLQLSMEQVKLADVFSECRSMILPLAEKNALTVDIDTSLDGHVVADFTRLKQVMLNLLSNAIKYNIRNGSVSIKVHQIDNKLVRISIIDTGTGISKEQLQEIFQPFNRLNAACNIEGTGIGLSISKELIEMMDGTIGVSSVVNEGSEFWIELPGSLDTSHVSSQGSEVSATDPYMQTGVASNKRILVAEDNPTNQNLILSQLETLGYDVELAIDGKDALSKMGMNQYELLITDCNMPHIDGYQLARTVRERGNKTIPIIALTADAFPEKKAACLSAGMNDQITKPVNLDTLKSTIEKYLN